MFDTVPDLAERVQAATRLLEQIVADRSMLAGLTVDERTRLLRAAGNVYEPDVALRRRQIKAQRREQKAQRARLDQGALDRTGIRALRAQPVFTTPDVFAPAFAPLDEVDPEADSARSAPRSTSPSARRRPTCTVAWPCSRVAA